MTPKLHLSTKSLPLSLSLKVWFLLLGLLAWLGILITIIIFIPKFLPAGVSLLSSNFDYISPRNNRGKIGPWSYPKDNIIWEADTGIKGSACVRLTAGQDSSPYLEWVLENPKHFSFLEFQGRMRTKHLVEGEKRWQTARLIVCFRDSAGRDHWDYPHEAGKLSGSSKWQKFSRVFRVPDFAASARVLLCNNGKSGNMWCDDIFLKPVRLNPRFLLFRNIALTSGLALAIVFVFFLQVAKDGRWLLVLLSAIIVIGVLCSESTIETIAHMVGITIFVLKKSGHFILFLLLTVISTRWLGYKAGASSIGSLFVYLSLFAAVTELLQLLTIDRTPTLQDWLIDIGGILTGILLAGKVMRKNIN